MLTFLQDANIWVLISFTIFCVIAWKLGRQGILNKLDTRIEEIKQEISTAETLRVEAQELLAQYQRKQRDAAREAEHILTTAKAQISTLRAEAENDLNEAMQRREAQLQERLQRMEQAALAEVKAYAADLAVKATAEIIARQMDDKTTSRLTDQSIAAVTAQINSDKAA